MTRLIVVLASFLAFTGPAAAAAGHSKMAAMIATKQALERASGKKVWTAGPLACVSPGGSGVSWICDGPLVHSSITFRLTHRIWRPTVYLLCKTAGTSPGTGCR